MSFYDIKKGSKKLGFKGASAGPWGEGKPEREGGVCPACDQYDVELDAFGYCRDEECRRNRFIKALRDGEAMKLPNGDLLWTPGTKCRLDK